MPVNTAHDYWDSEEGRAPGDGQRHADRSWRWRAPLAAGCVLLASAAGCAMLTDEQKGVVVTGWLKDARYAAVLMPRDALYAADAHVAGRALRGGRVTDLSALDQRAAEKAWAEAHSEDEAKVLAMESAIWGPPSTDARKEAAGRRQEDARAVAAAAADAQRQKDLEETTAQWKAVQEWEKAQEAKWGDAEGWRSEQEKKWDEAQARGEQREEQAKARAGEQEKMEKRVGDVESWKSELEKKWAEAEKARKAEDEAREKSLEEQAKARAGEQEKMEKRVGELESRESEQEKKLDESERVQEKSRQQDAIAHAEEEKQRKIAEAAKWKAAQEAAAKKVNLSSASLTVSSTV